MERKVLIMEKVSKGTIIRTACLVLAIVNNALAIAGKSPLPIDDAMIEMVVSFVFTTAASFAGYWKNNSWTKPAIRADEVLADLKAGEA